MEDVLIFANPISGSGRGRRIAHRLERYLRSAGYRLHVFLQKAREIPLDQIPESVTATIVIGGDGTLRAVAGRLLNLQSDGTTSPPPGPLLVVPMGTANLMGKHLGLRWDDATLESKVLAVLQTGRVIEIDTARANDQLLLLVAGIGLDAQVVHELDRQRTGPISYLSYAMPALLALGFYPYPALTVAVDGKIVFGPAPGVVFVGNVPEYGTGFPMLPLASAVDGLLDVCVLPCRSREELFPHLLRAAVGEHLHGEAVVYVKGRRVEIDSKEPVPVQVDGEAAGYTPLTIDLLAVKLGFIVPA